MPVNPRYMIGQSDRVTIFRNYEGVIGKYIEPEDTSTLSCPDHCKICDDRVKRGLDRPTVGLESLYAGDAFSLEPLNLARRNRKSSKEHK